PTEVVGLDSAGDNTFSSFAIMVRPVESLGNDADAWKKFAENETTLVGLALSREQAIEATNFDPQMAGTATQAAIMAMILGWLAMIIYLWVRFGQARWGLAAVLCLMHDVLIIVGLVAISNLSWVYDSAIGKALMIQPFKIDLTMIAALLTIIGYSVNDTIVVFDRIRENRGKLATVTPAIINASINQTLSRTLLTAGTVFVVVFVMYVWGGAGLHAFNYAFLIGVMFGTYSSIAVAAPMLLGFKGMMHRSMDNQPQPAGK
ncbi:MAG: protein translocase subunit SecF, partial [Planctomycetaceae bacterium]